VTVSFRALTVSRRDAGTCVLRVSPYISSGIFHASVDQDIQVRTRLERAIGGICGFPPKKIMLTFVLCRRFWSRTHELQDTLRDLAARIAALEAALRTSHAIHATKPHPLLAEDLLRIKEPHLRAPSSTAPASQPFVATRSSSSQDGTSTLSVPDFPSIAKADDTSSGMVEALGSLALNRNGRTKYFGPAALAAVSIPWLQLLLQHLTTCFQCFLSVCSQLRCQHSSPC
jgi:hypothetical protein